MISTREDGGRGMGNIPAGGVPVPGYPQEREAKLLPSISGIHYSPSLAEVRTREEEVAAEEAPLGEPREKKRAGLAISRHRVHPPPTNNYRRTGQTVTSTSAPNQTVCLLSIGSDVALARTTEHSDKTDASHKHQDHR
ncbi:uncharacterized protein LOC143143047 [Ptiloglossa arizonensis]|uniref:uncharacterized protein LOC143143047 n=1 Tax=Ptiloglossa arizonensis TaxID=3350558 RepID=UPI003FA13779